MKCTQMHINIICYKKQTNMTSHYSDIRVQKQIDPNGPMQWVPAPPDFAAAYMQYKARPAYSPEVPSCFHNTGCIDPLPRWFFVQ